ncbi:MAG TPA: hypothetical protein PLP33_24490 [Leptospiraceae bacterium]|nr:hypothetical protein [Leptospiraceae bacterium]
MGWLYSTSWNTKEKMVNHLVDSLGGKYVKHRLVGNQLWMIGKTAENEKFILLALIQSGGKGHGFGYKDMSESAHPYFYNCPLNFLSEVPPANEEWREGVRQYHKRKAEEKILKTRLQVGDTVSLVGCKIPQVRIYSLKPLRRIHDGVVYRLKPSLIEEIKDKMLKVRFVYAGTPETGNRTLNLFVEGKETPIGKMDDDFMHEILSFSDRADWEHKGLDTFYVSEARLKEHASEWFVN